MRLAIYLHCNWHFGGTKMQNFKNGFQVYENDTVIISMKTVKTQIWENVNAMHMRIMCSHVYRYVQISLLSNMVILHFLIALQIQKNGVRFNNIVVRVQDFSKMQRKNFFCKLFVFSKCTLTLKS